MPVFKRAKSEQATLVQQEPRIFTDSADNPRLSAMIRRIREIRGSCLKYDSLTFNFVVDCYIQVTVA
jgi:hypothetical protein